jgi:hypothetical protein
MGGTLDEVVGEFVVDGDRPTRLGPRGCGGLVAQYPSYNPPGLPASVTPHSNLVLMEIVPQRIKEPLWRTYELLLPSGVWELVGTTVPMKTFCSDGGLSKF